MNELDLDLLGFLQEIAGAKDKNLKTIEKRFDVQILSRDGKIRVRGEDEEKTENAGKLLQQLSKIVRSGENVEPGDLKHMINAFCEDPTFDVGEVFSEKIRLHTGKGDVSPRSKSQYEYVSAMRNYDVVLAIGPAGTGKTYLAMAAAISDLLRKRVSRIILTRPAVEAGESLGFLPGDLYEKVTPYIRPLHDALFDMLDADRVNSMMEQGLIEIAPLAYMRGRTLNDAFIILDEAQNSTCEQMKMFLTRLGRSSKVVVTGDITQIDLPSSRKSGLVFISSVLKDVEGLKIVNFTEKDVVRHPLVRKILEAYDQYENRDTSSTGNNS